MFKIKRKAQKCWH